MNMRMKASAWRQVAAVALAALALAPSAARAVEPPRSTPGPNDPGHWIETGFSPIPFEYYQGVTSAPDDDLYFDGFFLGLYRTDATLTEEARQNNEIPADVATREGYNHIGDLSWDAAEGGRLLLPLECFVPGVGNTCGTGSFAVADPATLAWRYYVKLDPADIKKAMWVESSPDGSLVWTSSGSDLLAYRSADIAAANAAPGGGLLKPVRRLAGAVPPSGVTGASFYGGRLLLAGQDTEPFFQVWSVDTNTGERRLEIEREISGESEGLDVFEGLGGVLHWQIGQITFGPPPTYGSGRTALVHFAVTDNPPDCSNVSARPPTLWPPNHRLVRIELEGATDPDGDPVTIEVTAVSQDEATGRGGPDAFLGPTGGTLMLRSERKGAGDGRVYRIAFRASDPQGEQCTGLATVTVPHSRAGVASDSASVYESLRLSGRR
jgi:hypothetical protein